MTRILTAAGIGDTHVSLSNRWEEGNRILDFFVEDIKRRQVGCVIHTGDVLDKLSRPDERLQVARFGQASAGVAPNVWVRGNHDAPHDLSIFDWRFLRTEYPLIVEESAGVHDVGDFLVGAVAWPKKAWLIADQDHADERKALQDILRGISAWEAIAENRIAQPADMPRKPRILAMHGMISGAQTSLGQPLVGCDMEIALDDLALANADLILLGHIHLPQNYVVNGAPVLYTGSSRRTAYGEVEEKSYVLATFTQAADLQPGTDSRVFERAAAQSVWSVSVERIPLPATPMYLIDGEYRDNQLILDAPEAQYVISGSDVRLRYRCTSQTRDAARAAAERTRDQYLQTGAASVMVDEQLTVVSTARAPEVARAATLPEKLRMMRVARGDILDETTEQRLNGRLVELESENR